MNSLTKRMMVLFSLPFISLSGRADVIEWQSANIQYLHGWNYELGTIERNIITTEYAAGGTYWDVFAFADVIRFDDGEVTYYGELSPRLSLSGVFGRKKSSGFINDVLLSANFEKGEGTSTRQLYGAAVDFNMPGFDFFKVNLYRRDDPWHAGSTHQLTIVWKSSFKVGPVDTVFEGFGDLAGNEGMHYHTNEHFSPRLLFDVGQGLGLGEKTLYMGMEFDYWRNKFGVNGITDTVPQFQIKWVMF